MHLSRQPNLLAGAKMRLVLMVKRNCCGVKGPYSNKGN